MVFVHANIQISQFRAPLRPAPLERAKIFL
jgi:hypothetical protein